MKGTAIFLQLAALSTAFVLPNEQVLNLENVEIETRRGQSVLDKLPSKSAILGEIEQTFEHVSEEISEVFDRVSGRAESEYKQFSKTSKHALDDAMSLVQEVGDEVEARFEEARFDAQAWFDSAMSHEVDMDSLNLFDHFGPNDENDHDHPPHPPHDGPPSDPHHDHPHPPHHGDEHDHPHPPHHGDDHDHPSHPPHQGGDDHDHPHPPHHGPPHRGRGPHRKSNMTVYQLISTSNYTTKLAKWVDEYPDIVKALNGSESNFTLFAPTDRAFEKIPEDAPKPSKEVLKKILSYHISPKCGLSAAHRNS